MAGGTLTSTWWHWKQLKHIGMRRKTFFALQLHILFCFKHSLRPHYLCNAKAEHILSSCAGKRTTGPMLTHASWKVAGSSSLQPSLWPWLKGLPSGSVFPKLFTPCFSTHIQKGPVAVRTKLRPPWYHEWFIYTLACRSVWVTSTLLHCQAPTKELRRLQMLSDILSVQGKGPYADL